MRCELSLTFCISLNLDTVLRRCMCADNFDPLRDVEQEKYIIGVAPYNSSLYPDLEEYFSVAFDSNERLERHMYVIH